VRTLVSASLAARRSASNRRSSFSRWSTVHESANLTPIHFPTLKLKVLITGQIALQILRLVPSDIILVPRLPLARGWFCREAMTSSALAIVLGFLLPP
jgi:hypothetical protein